MCTGRALIRESNLSQSSQGVSHQITRLTRVKYSRSSFVIVVPDSGGGSSSGYARHRSLLIVGQIAIVLMLTFDSRINPDRFSRKKSFNVRKSSEGSCLLFLRGDPLLPSEGDDSSSSNSTALSNELRERFRSTLWQSRCPWSVLEFFCLSPGKRRQAPTFHGISQTKHASKNERKVP